MMVVLLAATPALALKININPDTSNLSEGSPFRLNAVVSSQKNNCQYAWSQIDGPKAAVTQSADQPRFLDGVAPKVDAVATMKFQVVVTKLAGAEDQCGETGTAFAQVNVLNNGNSAPAANITVSPAEVYEGTVVELKANGFDADGDALTYLWEQIGEPKVTLSSTTEPVVYFTAPNDPNSGNGFSLQFTVTVKDPSGSTGTSTKPVTVKWLNDPPKAALSCLPATVDEGQAVTLDGSGATDSDDGLASYFWSQPLGYGGAAIALPEDTVTSKFDVTAPLLTSKNNKMTFALKVTDNGGLFDAATCDILVNDITPPVFSNVPANMTAEAQSAAGAAVVFNLPTAKDAVDGDRTVSCNPPSGSTFALDVTSTVKCSASDTSNNSAEATFTVKVQDTTPPALTLPAPIGPIEGNVYGGATITYSASALDIVDGAVGVTCDKSSGSVFSVGTTTVACSAADAHSNNASGSFAVTVVDTTPPVVTFGGDIADGSSFYFGSVPVAPTCTALDIVSGSVPCTVSGYSTLVGTHTLTAEASDKAGNTSKLTRTYTVLPWTLKGFYSPVDMSGVTNTVKGGATVPLKFEVFVGTTELTATSAVSSIQSKSVPCISMSSSEDPVDVTATGGTLLRYDTTAGQFIYNWQTPKLPGTCYIVTATTLDGSKISANFKLK